MADHRFNCEVFGDTMPLRIGDLEVQVPTSVRSEGTISGTIGGHPFSADLYCASLTNWYERFCNDPADPGAPCFQPAQPMLAKGLPFPRVTEVSIFDGVIRVGRGKKARAIPLLLATRAAGIMHLEDLTASPPEVGASVTHGLLGMVTYDADADADDGDAETLDGSADLLLQGHIFSPKSLSEDPGAAVIRGAICSDDLQKLLTPAGGKPGKGGNGDGD